MESVLIGISDWVLEKKLLTGRREILDCEKFWHDLFRDGVETLDYLLLYFMA